MVCCWKSESIRILPRRFKGGDDAHLTYDIFMMK